DRRLVDIDHLVEMFETVHPRMRRGMFERAIEPPRGRFIERIDDQRRFAAAGHASDAGEKPERDCGRNIFEIVAVRIDDFEFAAGFRRRPGIMTSRTPVRYWPVSEFLSAMISAAVPCATISPP